MKSTNYNDPITKKQKKYLRNLAPKLDTKKMTKAEAWERIHTILESRKNNGNQDGTKTDYNAMDFDKFFKFIGDKEAEISAEKYSSLKIRYGCFKKGLPEQQTDASYYHCLNRKRMEVCEEILKAFIESKAETSKDLFESMVNAVMKYELPVLGLEEAEILDVQMAQHDIAKKILDKLDLMWCENGSHYCNHNYKGEEIEPTKAFPEYENEVVADEQAEAPKKGHHGKPKGYSGHKNYSLWLPPTAIEDARILAKIRNKRLSAIVQEALTEYLADEERAKRVAKYKKFLSEFSEEIKAVKI